MSDFSALAKSDDSKAWQRALDSYEAAIKSKAAEGGRLKELVSLDKYVRETIPELVQQRVDEKDAHSRGHLKKEELCKIVQWKITVRGNANVEKVWLIDPCFQRGKSRPLMRYANALDPDEVVATTKKALKLASESAEDAMKALIVLRGIGPATASAILSLADSDGTCPFLSDEAMFAFGLANKAGKLDYTMPKWLQLFELCKSKAEKLNEGQGDDERQEWTAALVERAVWADAV